MKLWILVFIAAFISLMFVTHGQTVPMQGLVLYLPLDEGKGDTVKDLSGNKNDGVLKGKPEWAKGKYGSALQFDGEENKNYVEVQDNPTLNPAAEVSCAAWIYIDKFVGSGGVISKYIGANSQRSWSIRMAHDNLWGFASDCSSNGTFDAGKGMTTETPANTLKAGQWQHVAMTFKAKQFHRVYVDGELKGETKANVIDGLFDNNTPFLVGTDFQIGGQHRAGQPREFTGIIDEVVVFNRAISEAEVKSIMEGRIRIIAVEPNGKLASRWGEMKKL